MKELQGGGEKMSKIQVRISYFFNKNSIELRKQIQNCLIKEIGGVENKIKIKKGKYGKPYIANEHGIDYNIAHTIGVGVIAFCEHSIGVDVEYVRGIPEEVLKRCYHSEEQQYVLEANGKKEMERRFYEVWTKKEAYVKYLGVGINNQFPLYNVFDKLISDNFHSIYINDYIITVYVEGECFAIWEKGRI